MATITSNASGLWSAAGTWVGGVPPVEGDKVIILAAHTVTVDGTYTAGDNTVVETIGSAAINVYGTLKASRTVSSSLTGKGLIMFDVNSVLDYGTDADPIPQGVNATLILNKATTPAVRAGISNTIPTSNAHAITYRFCGGKTRTRNCVINTAVASGQAVLVLTTSAHGWEVGDEVLVLPTNASATVDEWEVKVIQSIAGASITMTTNFTYNHAAGSPASNFTSNVVVKSFNTSVAQTGRIRLRRSSNFSGSQSIIAIDTLFSTMGNSTNSPMVELVGQNYYLNSDSFDRCAFRNPTNISTAATNITYNSKEIFTNCAFDLPLCGFTSVSNYFSADSSVFKSGVVTNGFLQRNSVVSNSWVCFTVGSPTIASHVGQGIFRNCTFSGLCVMLTNGGGQPTEFENCDIGATYGMKTQFADKLFRFTGTTGVTSSVKLKDCIQAATFDTPGSASDLSNQFDLYVEYLNKGRSVTAQEIYTHTGSIIRDNSAINRSTSSFKFTPHNVTVNLARPIERTQSIPVANGATIRVIGYVKVDTAFYNGGNWNPPTVTISGLGITPVVFTASSAASGAFEKFDISATNSVAGYDGNLTLTYSANLKTLTGGSVYIDGVPDAPFVTKARHYGFNFDEASPTRTTNTVTSASETTASAYTGITVTWGTTSPVAINANKTFQYLYDYTQYQACLPANLPFAVPLTGVGVAGAPSLFAAGNVTTTGYTLNGGGSLSMGGYTLTATLPWAYTYTGGTFSQATTVPSFGGGQLNIGAAGTYTFGMTASTIISMTPTAPGTYAMGAGTFSGTVDLRNAAAHAITVQLPAGTTYTTASNVGGTITVSVPTVTQGLNFTGLSAGSQVKVFTTATTSELFSDSSSGTSETWSQAGGSDTVVDYTIMKAGFLPIRVVGVTVNSAVVVVPVSQVVDRSYSASSGLTYGSTATVNTGTSRFTVTVATTIQNWYSFMIESWIAESGLKNRAFPISSNGPNSFTLEGWEFSAGLSFLYRDGLRYTSAGVATAIYSAIYSVDTEAGMQVRYQQADGTGTTDAATAGKIDQLVQVYGDASHGNSDKRGYLTLKIQRDGYDQAETDVVALYGSMEDQLYVVGLNPISNGLATGSPFVAGSPTITDHGASPVTWNSKQFSITITDSAAGNDGETLMRWIRYNLDAGGAFEGKDGYNWHDLVQINGASYKTVRGAIYGDTGAALKGVRVLTDAGDPHPDFNLFTADDGTTYAPPPQISISIFGVEPGSRVQLYDTTNSVELLNEVAGIASVFTETYSVDRAIRLRIAYVDGTDARKFVEANIGSVSEGEPILTYQLAQVNDEVYIANGIDGSTVTECEIVGTNLFIGINTGSISIARIYAFMTYWLSTVGGIEDQTTEMIAKDTANYIVNTGFQIRNNTTGPTVPLLITGGNIDPATGIATDILDTSGGSIFVNSAIVVPYSSGAEATVAIVQAGLSAQGLTTPVVARIDAPVSTRATAGDVYAAS